jgi:enamine deaminase RidA (YjgF/YER057c/UK114 family)
MTAAAPDPDQPQDPGTPGRSAHSEHTPPYATGPRTEAPEVAPIPEPGPGGPGDTGTPWEETAGAARAVALGDLVLVSGTMPLAGAVLEVEGDPYQQTLFAFRDAVAALEEFGLGLADVVRTRVYVAHTRDVAAAAAAHKELFAAVRPVTTIVVVSALADSRVLVEVEIEAYRGSAEVRRAAPAASPEAAAPSEGNGP